MLTGNAVLAANALLVANAVLPKLFLPPNLLLAIQLPKPPAANECLTVVTYIEQKDDVLCPPKFTEKSDRHDPGPS